MTTTVPAELLALDRSCYPSNPLTERQWRGVLEGERWLAYAFREGEKGDGARVAYVIAEVVAENGGMCTRIRRLGVQEESRRKGVAKALLASLDQYPCEAEVREDNLPALKLLTGCGFGVLGVERGRFGDCDGVTLWRGANTGVGGE